MSPYRIRPAFRPWLAAMMLAIAAVFSAASTVHAAAPGRNEAIKRQLVHSPGLQRDFPRLGKNFEVIRDGSKRYNCIAWSLGVDDEWIDPMTGPVYAPLRSMDLLYAEQGYSREPDLNWRLEPGREKVVLYATLDPDGTIRQVTHAAHQEPDGTFTSKLGQLPVIRHETPEALRGPVYGTPVAVYVRPIDGNHTESVRQSSEQWTGLVRAR